MLKATYRKHTLQFKRPGGTSRGVLHEKDSWFIFLRDVKQPVLIGIGECSIIPGLSVDDRPDLEKKIAEVCADIERIDYWLEEGLFEFPALRFALETALIDLEKRGSKILFETPFVEKNEPISINGLIWMGSAEAMLEQIDVKLKSGFHCLKMKIGAIDFDEELRLLGYIREQYDASQIELRVDANGAFPPDEALDRLEKLARYDLHSIEQPIKQGQWAAMKDLCKHTPLPIALDEELIGVVDRQTKAEMLETIQPQYLILKPSLVGGFAASSEWIELAEENSVGWWATSALESNIGLNAIAQWIATYNNPLPQGLGTGQLFTNNIESPLLVENGSLYFGFSDHWALEPLLNHA